MKISTINLRKTLSEALLTKYSQDAVSLMLPVILYGEYSGIKSHGIIRILADKFAVLKQIASENPKVIKKTNSSTFFDMQGSNGIFAGAYAMNEILKISSENSIAIVGTKNSYGSSGCLSYYAKTIAKKGFIGIIAAKPTPSVAPFTTYEKILGTNPIAFGVPKKDGVFIFDMATSSITRGAVVRAQILNNKLPDGVALDKNGHETTNPTEALEGVFKTFGGYKGSGLALIVEILAGVLTGADFGGLSESTGWGNLFITINPTLISDNLEEFKKNVEKLIMHIKNAKTVDGKEVRIPGELEASCYEKAIKDGFIEVDDMLITEIENYTKSFKIK